MAKAPKNKVYKITGRSGSVISFVAYNPITGNEGATIERLDLKGFGYNMLRKGVNIIFEGKVAPENLVYDYVVNPTKLVANGEPKTVATPKESKSASKAMPIFEVLKRVGSTIHYRILGSEHGIDLSLDLTGFGYKKLKKGEMFQFEGGVVSAENLRIVTRGSSEKTPLVKVEYAGKARSGVKTAVKSKRGATPNVSILRKHF
ncbi:hypothetical protein pEaSNUABM6_00128 [Erwinia phage pEa_SNUABM_6]|nr:hypothetical protein pEaSNUABM6_00128 [Erwinia phage pEa_SNUABM_6]